MLRLWLDRWEICWWWVTAEFIFYKDTPSHLTLYLTKEKLTEETDRESKKFWSELYIAAVCRGYQRPNKPVPGDCGYYLHAHQLVLSHPITNEVWRTIKYQISIGMMVIQSQRSYDQTFGNGVQ